MCIGGDAYTRTCPSALYTGGREHWSVLTIVVMGIPPVRCLPRAVAAQGRVWAGVPLSAHAHARQRSQP